MKLDIKGYPWNFVDSSRPWRTSFLVTVLSIGVGIASFVVYNRISGDISPDSIAGYTYATVGTIFLVMAAVSYSVLKSSRKRGVGALNGALHWHISFAVIGLTMIFLHSFGNFNARTGTYALYGLIALVISGAVGRTIDRLAPRLIAREVRKAITEQGEDRIEHITQSLQSIMSYNKQQVRSFQPDQQFAVQAASARPKRGDSILPDSWDLAYITLDETPQEANRDATRYRFVPDRKSSLTQPGALLPGVQEHMAELQNVQRALHHEQFYRAMICYWRLFHVSLTILTTGLVLWHLEYAAELLIPTFFHH